jgi:hypothetical protein
MKKVIYLAALAGVTLIGCEKRRDAATELTSPEFSGTEVEEVQTADGKERRRSSHVDFQKAVELYGQKKYADAGDFLRQGNASLKGELHTINGDLKSDAVEVVREITLLVGKVKDGKVESMDALQKPLGEAQRIVALNYFRQVQDNINSQPPDEISHQVNLGLEAMENSFRYGNVPDKQNLQPVISETRELVSNAENINRQQVSAQLQKLTGSVRSPEAEPQAGR